MDRKRDRTIQDDAASARRHAPFWERAAVGFGLIITLAWMVVLGWGAVAGAEVALRYLE